MILRNLNNEQASVILFDNDAIGFFIVDKDQNRIVFISPSTGKLFNSEIEALPDALLDRVVKKDRKRVMESYNQLLSGNLSKGIFRVQDGKNIRWIRVESFKAMDPYQVGIISFHQRDPLLQKTQKDLKDQKSSIINFLQYDLMSPIENMIKLSNMCEIEALKTKNKRILDYIGLQRDIGIVIKDTLGAFVEAFTKN